jgi:hypothetical protein
MTYGPELDPTPLQRRLGQNADRDRAPSHSDSFTDDADDMVDELDHHHAEPDPEPDQRDLEGPPAFPTLPMSWHQQLAQAADEGAKRMDRWIVDQRRRVADGLDRMLIELEERKQSELARLESWKTSERQRIEDELDDERERFHARLLDELKAFEEQLALRLDEQEERLARWWDEAEQMAKQRFAALGLERGAAEGAQREE